MHKPILGGGGARDGSGRERGRQCVLERERSERTWWQIDYSSDMALELVLMTAAVGG